MLAIIKIFLFISIKFYGFLFILKQGAFKQTLVPYIEPIICYSFSTFLFVLIFFYWLPGFVDNARTFPFKKFCKMFCLSLKWLVTKSIDFKHDLMTEEHAVIIITYKEVLILLINTPNRHSQRRWSDGQIGLKIDSVQKNIRFRRTGCPVLFRCLEC